MAGEKLSDLSAEQIDGLCALSDPSDRPMRRDAQRESRRRGKCGATNLDGDVCKMTTGHKVWHASPLSGSARARWDYDARLYVHAPKIGSDCGDATCADQDCAVYRLQKRIDFEQNGGGS